MSYYPFDRKLNATLSDPDYVLSISGQKITIKLHPSVHSSGDFKADPTKIDLETSQQDYIFRYQLGQLSEWAWLTLFGRNKRDLADVLRGLQVLREQIWDGWDELSEDGDPNCYCTGMQAGDVGHSNYRAWVIYSDPSDCIETMPEDWLTLESWNTRQPWTWPEIHQLLVLWYVDEAIAYLNIGNPYKASLWLSRAVEAHAWSNFLDDSLYGASIREVASMGGAARGAAYKPLKNFVIEKVMKGSYPSRNNAAQRLAPHVIELAKKLDIPFSEYSAVSTINKWLKDAGLPKK